MTSNKNRSRKEESFKCSQNTKSRVKNNGDGEIALPAPSSNSGEKIKKELKTLPNTCTLTHTPQIKEIVIIIFLKEASTASKLVS
jgi:hypothetical protein